MTSATLAASKPFARNSRLYAYPPTHAFNAIQGADSIAYIETVHRFRTRRRCGAHVIGGMG
jgi:hypothetical protein